MCSECHSVAAPGNYDLSEKCCTCYDCGKPLAKDERIPYAEGRGKSLYHRDCERQRRMKRDAEALDKAELVADYDGPVYFEGSRGSYGEGYFENVQELAEHLDMDDDQSGRPEFAFCCEEMPFRGVDAQSLIESACEEMDEDASERLDGIEELEKACAAFNKLNENVISWSEDRKHKVAIPGVVA
jgi:hypothetical protein